MNKLYCTSCTLWVCILCAPPVELSCTTFRQSETACSDRKMKNKSHSLHMFDFEECHHQEFQFRHDEDDEDKVCARSPCCSVIPLPSRLSINNVVIFFTSFKLLIRILSSLFAWVHGCTELLRFCHMLVLQSLTFVLFLRNLGVVVEVVCLPSTFFFLRERTHF